MGIIKAFKLGFDYLKYDEDGNVQDTQRAVNCFHCADCCYVIRTEESSCITAIVQKMMNTFISFFRGMNNIGYIFLIDGNAGIG